MILALYILLAIVGVGSLLYLLDKKTVKAEAMANPREQQTTTDTQDPALIPAPEETECCGMHITCEKDSLLASVSDKIEYYDDEELDAYRGRQSHEYADAEIEEFRDVLLTLLPSDIAGWGRSLQLRGIILPEPVREELLMIVAEERERKIEG